MESCGIHAVLAIKSHQTQWNLVGPMSFSSHMSSNPMESYGVHKILSNFIKSNGILWNPMDFSHQIPSNPIGGRGVINPVLALLSLDPSFLVVNPIFFLILQFGVSPGLSCPEDRTTLFLAAQKLQDCVCRWS